MRKIASDLFGGTPESIAFVPAPSLAKSKIAAGLVDRLGRGERVLVYFDSKTGGEIQVGSTPASPQIAFDTTFVELAMIPTGGITLGRFAIVEIQTMDFHGSYGKAVDNLTQALRLHEAEFPEMVQRRQDWLSQGIQGPNIANVFKRTFYQLLFKFEIARSPTCAGTALAIPEAVWDSWQRFLGAPKLLARSDGTFKLPDPLDSTVHGAPSRIYVFDADGAATETPSPLVVRKVIEATPEALAHHATEVAPRHAMAQLSTALYPMIRRRINAFLSETGVTVE